MVGSLPTGLPPRETVYPPEPGGRRSRRSPTAGTHFSESVRFLFPATAVAQGVPPVGARIEEGRSGAPPPPQDSSGLGPSLEVSVVLSNERRDRDRKIRQPRTLLPLSRGGRGLWYTIATVRAKGGDSRTSENEITTLSSGSLGSRVDEERSQLRDLV